MTDTPQNYAVLTGDLIQSTRHSADARDQAMQALSDTLDGIADTDKLGPPRFTRFRGDGWQAVLTRPEMSLRIALLLTATLKSNPALPETRISIGIGAVEALTDDNLNSASGAAFITSGHGLNQMKGATELMIEGDGITPLHRAIVALTEIQMRGWTAEQAELCRHFLTTARPSQRAIAERLGITPQSVHDRAKAAQAKPLRNVIELWEADWSQTE